MFATYLVHSTSTNFSECPDMSAASTDDNLVYRVSTESWWQASLILGSYANLAQSASKCVSLDAQGPAAVLAGQAW